MGGYLTGESLTALDWDGRSTSGLASSQWSADRLSLRLQLHPNIVFHDGTRLDAPLAKELLQRVMNPETPSGGSVSFESVTRIEVQDPNTLTLRLSQPEAFLREDLANATLPHPSDSSLGAGPFKLVAPAAGGNVTRLEAFADYYRGRPEIDVIEVQSYNEQRSAWAALMRGDIDAVHEVSPNVIDLVESQTTVQTFSSVRPYYIALWFNVRHPLMKDARVRQALSYGVDRQQLIDQGLNKRGEPAAGPVWPYHWAYTPAERSYSLNREAASIQLDAVGRFPRKSSGPGMQGRFRFTCITLAGDRYEKLALLLQKQLYAIGVDMQIEALPLRELFSRLQSRNFEAILLERASGRSLGWTYLTFHSKSTPAGYKAADRVLDQMRSAITDHALRDALNRFHRVLYDDPPAIFLAWPTVARAVRSTFVVPEEPGRDVLGSLRHWRAASLPQ